MKSGTDLINEAKSRITQITAAEALEKHGRDGIVFLDVRDQQEVNLGKVPGAVHISRGNLEGKIDAAIPREREVVVYCASGNRSALAALMMTELGFENVCSLASGFRGWAEAGGEIEG
ncbi:MAG: hypothetical protein H0W68_06595 [Gemmatimonadaceae bacterium]|nr:hypothetical protein [Gemmatimonadaceae bacterium]